LSPSTGVPDDGAATAAVIQANSRRCAGSLLTAAETVDMYVDDLR